MIVMGTVAARPSLTVRRRSPSWDDPNQDNNTASGIIVLGEGCQDDDDSESGDDEG